jgi:hypothetical protein
MPPRAGQPGRCRGRRAALLPEAGRGGRTPQGADRRMVAHRRRAFVHRHPAQRNGPQSTRTLRCDARRSAGQCTLGRRRSRCGRRPGIAIETPAYADRASLPGGAHTGGNRRRTGRFASHSGRAPGARHRASAPTPEARGHRGACRGADSNALGQHRRGRPRYPDSHTRQDRAEQSGQWRGGALEASCRFWR